MALEARRLLDVREHSATAVGVAGRREHELRQALVLHRRAPPAEPQVELRIRGARNLRDDAVRSRGEVRVEAVRIGSKRCWLIPAVRLAAIDPDPERTVARRE
jgi:hypothetical protein